ncbi:hypothetical protein BV455_03462 [Parageobacillus caldoxylosilyticus]|uniref:DUF6454 family protein n=1 Tax=Saccharococcus caldoxylosilyticus TaxID=81408 RepID=UPI001C4E17D9|nr:DUF6454 family protein [Parageobacillus caldoxylosilyticus]QXJ40089.1 hypothetical protein BV455_03462 [Parageobacillus caldoxylosilyticus]
MRKIVFTVTTTLLIGIASTVLAMPQSHITSTKEQKLDDQFRQLSRDTKWQQKEKIHLQFNAYHPQGMTRIGDLYYMSSVEIIEKPVKYDTRNPVFLESAGQGLRLYAVPDDDDASLLVYETTNLK